MRRTGGDKQLDAVSSSSSASNISPPPTCAVVHCRIEAVFEPSAVVSGAFAALRGLRSKESQHNLAVVMQSPASEDEHLDSSSDTSSSSSSAESPPGTLTMYEMGATLLEDDDETADHYCAADGRRLAAAAAAGAARSLVRDSGTTRNAKGTTSPADWRTGVSDPAPMRCSMTRDATSAGDPEAIMKPSRRLRNLRALSSECLEGLGWGETRDGDNSSSDRGHQRRLRTESEPLRIPESPFARVTDPLSVSGAPSDREQNNLLRQYSSEASRPPPQVLQGWKLNHVPLDKRSWLEVWDERHRYGKNLRLYFKEWEGRGKPDGSFFKWLSTPEVQLDGCPRHELENDVVHYCHPEERVNYALTLDVTNEGRAMLHTARGEPVNSGPNAWLFVLRDQTIFATDKKTDPPRFHHSSFFGGGCVEAAGMLVAENGVLVTLYPHSGHYRPTNLHLHRLLLFLRGLGVDLSAIQVDAQRVHKVARPDKKAERRHRKMDNPYMVSGQYLLDFFEAKHKAWSSDLFTDVCQTANAWNPELIEGAYGWRTGGDNASVGESGDAADGVGGGVGGYRARMGSGGGATVIATARDDGAGVERRPSTVAENAKARAMRGGGRGAGGGDALPPAMPSPPATSLRRIVA